MFDLGAFIAPSTELKLDNYFPQLDRGLTDGHGSRTHVSLVYLVRSISNALATPTYATISFWGTQ
jgi:hypothetical protein